jgi:hypothetical protein
MTRPDQKPDAADLIHESAKTERHPATPESAGKDERPAVPGGVRPDAAVAEDRAHPGMIDKSKD